MLSALPGAFNLYDLDHDGFITRQEMLNIVEAIYAMVVSGYADMHSVDLFVRKLFKTWLKMF